MTQHFSSESTFIPDKIDVEQPTTNATPRLHQLLIDGRPATDAEYTRVMNAKPKPAQRPVHGSLSSNRGFRLLR